MSRIVINPDQLAETASVLQATAGEYEAVGAQVAACDCGCMPADVAAVVDSVTAEARAGLEGIAGELAVHAQGLGWRADVPQTGGTTLVVGGEPTHDSSQGGIGLLVYPDASPPSFTGGDGGGLVIHSDYGSSVGSSGGLVIGNQPAAAGVTLVISGSSDPAIDDNSYLEAMRSGRLPDLSGGGGSVFGVGGLGQGISSPNIPIGSVEMAYGMDRVDLAGMLIGGYGPNNAQGFVTYDRGIQWGPLGTFPRVY